MATSYDGKLCSVVWPDAGAYVILAADTVGTSWIPIAQGAGIAIAWATCTRTFAVVHVPKVDHSLFVRHMFLALDHC